MVAGEIFLARFMANFAQAFRIRSHPPKLSQRSSSVLQSALFCVRLGNAALNDGGAIPQPFLVSGIMELGHCRIEHAFQIIWRDRPRRFYES